MPVIWLIDAYRAGERGQVRALVERLGAELGAECRTLSLAYRTWAVLPHLLGLASVQGVTPRTRTQLAPPWPDLVVSCGVRNEPVCRWIRARSGGHTRYVHVGRPWGPLSSFDLVVTTPQYRVASAANVVQNTFTLHGLTAQRLDAAGQRWAPVFQALPRPWLGVLVGGDSGPFTLGPRAVQRLARECRQWADATGGSLLVSTSARTSRAASDALQAALAGAGEDRYYVYRHGTPGADNPYAGILALADALLVTADSVAMLSEACATGKPVAMFDNGGMRGRPEGPVDRRLGATLYRLLLRWFPQRLSRDITCVHQRLQDDRRAQWFDPRQPLAGAPPAAAPPGEDMQRAVAGVRRLLS
jgi:mitochondrial fission protein ELM1